MLYLHAHKEITPHPIFPDETHKPINPDPDSPYEPIEPVEPDVQPEIIGKSSSRSLRERPLRLK